MNVRSWMPAALLLTLVVATGGGWWWTREPQPATPEGAASEPAKSGGRRRQGPRRERLVDQTPLLTARSLMPLAASIEEQQLALQAERLANHEVDLAFTDAIRRAAAAQLPDDPAIRALAEARAKAQAAVEADQQVIARLTRQLEKAPESRKDALEDQLEVARAQLALDQDELGAATEDLGQAGGDPQARIRRLKEAHEAADRESAQAKAGGRGTPTFPPGSLLARLAEWRAQRAKITRLDQARQEAQAKIQALAKRRETIEARAKEEQGDREAAKFWAANLVTETATAEGGPGRDQAREAVSYLARYAEVQRRLSDMGRRIQDQQGLVDTYSTWMALADGYRTAALHGLLAKVLWVLGLAGLAYALGALVDLAFHRRASRPDRTGTGTLRTVTKLVLRVVCGLIIGFVVFGVPAQATTILGLAGAGLTVALKDFIVAFFGWFILMGRNGLRVGDWVEIRGVGGEVVEIGFLRTVVLETGSWSDAGHPTGRRVAFVNNFAIEGHFFNFSTRGQWMWDELRAVIPLGQDPYPLIDGIQRLVERQTEANARVAEQEWRQATARYRVQAFSTAPGLNIVPTLNGVEIRARYITRAFERHETRLRLNQAVVELMHGRRGSAPLAPEKVEER